MTTTTSDALVLTFAEIAFLSEPYPDRAVTVRERLGLPAAAASDAVAAAGLASLLARGLCRLLDCPASRIWLRNPWLMVGFA